MLVVGGEGLDGSLSEIWALTLRDSATWVRLPVSGTLPLRRRPAAIFDPVRERVVLFGGDSGGTGFGSFYNDVWSVSPYSQAQWTQLSVAGTGPTPRTASFGAYDPVRDGMLVVGGNYGYSMPFDETWSLSLSGSPSWRLLDPSERPESIAAPLGVFVPDGPRLFLLGDIQGYSPTGAWLLDWKLLPAPAVQCPPDILVGDEDTATAYYAIENTQFGIELYDFEVHVDRQWPSFPLRGSTIVSGLGTSYVPIGIPIPDTAAGSVTLRFVTRNHDDPRLEDECSHRLGDVLTPIRIAFLGLEARWPKLRLRWQAQGSGVLAARVHRSEDGAAWADLGPPALEGSDQLVFEDSLVVPGKRYGYRLLSTTELDSVLDERWIDVPVLNLALRGFTPNPARDAPRIAFSLATGAPARLEVFDLQGRHVFAMDLTSLDPGEHMVSIGRPAHSGVYPVRLTQAGRGVVAKGCIFE